MIINVLRICLSIRNIPCMMKNEISIQWVFPQIGWCYKLINVDGSSSNDGEQTSCGGGVI